MHLAKLFSISIGEFPGFAHIEWNGMKRKKEFFITLLKSLLMNQ